MLDVADMSAREVDNDEVVCIDGLLRQDKDIRCNVCKETLKSKACARHASVEC